MQHLYDRRQFVRGGLTGAASIAFAALAGCTGTGGRARTRDYGPVSPVDDLTTGLPLIALPAGFSYRSFGWTGQPMSDGQPTPSLHDGTAVVATSRRRIVLVRNHEQDVKGIKARGLAGYDDDFAFGGTSTLAFDPVAGRWLDAHMSLSGTMRNCAGGFTPWGSWITAEESLAVSPAGVRHGWHFEVPAQGRGTGRPLEAMGRSSWEACAVDPATGHVYQTEDLPLAGFYRFVPRVRGRLEEGGELYALAAQGQPDFNFGGYGTTPDRFADFEAGRGWDVEWVRVTDPAGTQGPLHASAPGRAGFRRLEGCWYDSGRIYFVSTSGGLAQQGQIFCYEPARERLTMVFTSRGAGTGPTECNMPDNIAVSPRGGIVLCENGANPVQRLRGLTQEGTTFVFAENRVQLTAADIGRADAALGASGAVAAALAAQGGATDFSGQEWTGACFQGDWMFVNVQMPGITLAITGPWRRGGL